jgi:hypothetical protein
MDNANAMMTSFKQKLLLKQGSVEAIVACEFSKPAYQCVPDNQLYSEWVEQIPNENDYALIGVPILYEVSPIKETIV